MEIVGIGHNCSVVSTLKTLGLMSKEKFVFDNMGTKDLAKFSRFLMLKGTGWFLRENVEWLDHKSTSEWLGGLNIAKFSCHAIVDNKWDIMSGHDVSIKLNKEDALQQLIGRKESLMERFFKLMKKQDKLLIIRSNNVETKLEEIIFLHDVISELRENRPFSLCVFQNVAFADKNYGIESLELYRTREPFYKKEQKKWVSYPEWKIAFATFAARHNLQIKLL